MVKTKVSKVEEIKERSNFLREPVASELKNDLNYFSQDAIQVLKFHGSYQQDNRDNRVRGQEKDYSMMLRTRNPGGIIESPLFLALDRLSDDYGNGTLRVTTRQGFQIHGIVKNNLKATIAEIVRCMGSTLGACGDLNRNVMAPPAPFKEKAGYEYARQYAKNIADLLTPQTGAYYDIWLDGEKAITAEEDEAVVEARQRNTNGTNFDKGEEPIYGTQYLPRKFKCCVTVPGDNSVDIYTHDLSLVVITNRSGQLEGFNVLVGGGLGRTHRKEETFARLAEPLGFVSKDKIYDVVKAIIAVQRDYGNRSQRRVSRMKYLINDWGIKKFKKEVEKYLGSKIAKSRELPPWEFKDYLGWHEQEDGKYFVGIPVENGRVKDDADIKDREDGDGKAYLKTALRKICQQFKYPMLLTGNHNIVLYNIVPEFKSYVDNILSFYNVVFEPEKLDPITRYSMACPALPTCGLALTESERVLPSINQRIRELLTKLGMADLPIVVRMTGCPNGCARPYMAELGFVGSDREAYQVWLGGTPNQTTLAQPIADKMKVDDLESFLEPIFVFYREKRQDQESFGAFCNRIGLDQIRAYMDNPDTVATSTPDAEVASDDSAATAKTDTNAKAKGAKATKEKKAKTKKAKDTSSKGRKIRYRVGVHDQMYEVLKGIAAEEEKSMTQLVDEALNSYLDGRK